METKYKHSQVTAPVPVEMVLEPIEGYQFHRHKQLELFFVLEGSINLRIEGEVYRLEENDIVIVDRYKLHGLFKTSEPNAVLRFQIDTDYYNSYFPGFSTKYFVCNTTLLDRSLTWSKDTPYAKMRQQLAMLAYQWNKKESGYQFAMATAVLTLGSLLLNHFESPDEMRSQSTKEIERLNRILDYIDKNFEKGVTLKEIAEIEELNFYYLSTFIKQNLGLSFQEYMNMKRIEKVMGLLVTTRKSVTDIAFESGFSTTKALNQVFKRLLHMTPTAFRETYTNNQRELVKLDPFGLRTNLAESKPDNYLELVEKLYGYL